MDLLSIKFLWRQQPWKPSTVSLAIYPKKTGRCHRLGGMNKKLLVSAAFLDPFEHSQIKSMCDLAPGLNYDMIKKTVIDEVRFLTPDDFVRCSTPSRSAKFAQSGHNAIEKEMNSYAALLSIGENPLDFWRNNEKYFPYLATLARLVLSVPASSFPSERAFKELRCIIIDFTRNR
uniref:HAT C-terminal dimerisation domain-containing protein n=1 Tax=Ditylenchus dipsaci TaxID=166011 RepID=A0A915EFS8_9BILA